MNLEPIKLNVTVDKAHRRYVLAQPCVPKDLDISAPLLNRLHSVEHALCKISTVQPSLVRRNILRLNDLTLTEQASHVHIAPLRHRLGEAAVLRCHASQQVISWRADLERYVLDQRCDALLQSLEQPGADVFIAELLTICAMVNGMSSTAFRTGGVRLAGDKEGWTWQFPDRQGITKCLTALHGALKQRALGSAIVEATVAYVILNWMHPFADGNGRTSRVVFNAMLRRFGVAVDHYVPIKEINFLARGGHEVRLRYTMATVDWQELLEYFVNATALYRVLCQQEEFPNNLETTSVT